MAPGEGGDQPKLDLRLTREGLLDDKLTLVSLDAQQRGPNLLSVLIDARQRVLDLVSNGITALIGDGQDGAGSPCESPWRSTSRDRLRRLARRGRGVGHPKHERRSSRDGHATQLQTRPGPEPQPRAGGRALHDAATAGRRATKAGEAIGVYELQDGPDDVEDAVTPDTLFRVFLEPWVGLGEVKAQVVPGSAVRFQLPDWTTTVAERP